MLGKENPQRKLFLRPKQLRDLIPDDYILVKVNRVLDLSWLEGRVKHLYSEDKGRPSIPPEKAMRLMLAGLILSIIGDRRLIREAKVNLAIRWFAGYELDDEIPDHSSLTRIRERWGGEIFQETFRKVLEDCDKAGLLGRGTIHIDSTLIRADASIDSMVDAHLEEVARENETDDGDKRERICSTDPDATMARSSSRSKFEPRYKAHVAVDDKHGVVVDVKVTTGSTNENHELLEQVKRVEENVGVRPERVVADAAYSSGGNYHELEEMGIKPFIVPKKEGKRGKCFSVGRFKYDNFNKLVKCPARKKLKRSHRDSYGWFYIAKESDCRACRLKAECVARSQKKRKLQIIDGYDGRLRALRRKAIGDEEYTEAIKRRKWIAEGRHAEAKVVHCMRRAQRRGLQNVYVQVVLTMVVMNLKKLASTGLLALNSLLQGLSRHLQPFRITFLSQYPSRDFKIPLPSAVTTGSRFFL